MRKAKLSALAIYVIYAANFSSILLFTPNFRYSFNISSKFQVNFRVLKAEMRQTTSSKAHCSLFARHYQQAELTNDAQFLKRRESRLDWVRLHTVASHFARCRRLDVPLFVLTAFPWVFHGKVNLLRDHHFVTIEVSFPKACDDVRFSLKMQFDGLTSSFHHAFPE